MARSSLDPKPAPGHRVARLLEPAEPRAAGRRHDRDLYTALERRVMADAEAMTATPPEVTDEMVPAP